MCYNNIGMVYQYIGDYAKALEFLFKALVIKKKDSNGNNRSIAMTYHNIGALYSRKGDYNKALEYEIKALEIREKF